MAISKDIWEKARTLYESGKLSLSEISTKTGIDKSSISKKAKIQQWKNGEHSDYIDSRLKIVEKKSTLSVEKINTLDDIANELIRYKDLVYNVQEKALNKANEMLDYIDTAKDLKDIIDGVDKASITLGVNQRHSTSQVNVNTQTNVQNNILSLDDFYNR
jgi:transcriptional regulator with XRE-family HTH domain